MSPGQRLIEELRTSESQPPAPGDLRAAQTAALLSANVRGSDSEHSRQSYGTPSPLKRGGSGNSAEAGPGAEGGQPLGPSLILY